MLIYVRDAADLKLCLLLPLFFANEGENPALANRTTGVVKWFNAEKGMGFLITAGGADIFVAASAISASCNGHVAEGQAVEFDIIEVGSLKKRTAKDVTCR